MACISDPSSFFWGVGGQRLDIGGIVGFLVVMCCD